MTKDDEKEPLSNESSETETDATAETDANAETKATAETDANAETKATAETDANAETDAATQAADPPSASADSDVATQAADPPGANGSKTLDVIMDLDLPLTVRFGQTFMTLGALTRLGAGAEISLDRAATDPVELLVNGKVIARGDVVAVEGNYAVRITDIVSPSERLINVGG